MSKKVPDYQVTRDLRDCKKKLRHLEKKKHPHLKAKKTLVKIFEVFPRFENFRDIVKCALVVRHADIWDGVQVKVDKKTQKIEGIHRFENFKDTVELNLIQ